MSEGIAAFLTAWQRGEGCCQTFRPGSELAFSPQPQPTLTLRILPSFLSDSLLRQVLTWRFQHPDRYDGCFISIEADGSLAVCCHPSSDDDPYALISMLSSLLNLQ
ncbi:hypothetical protein [Erwinia sp. 9145]|uniref:hypothetical protein n=1 Tax=Erwinia sp. 9145 TaxID=1500895 RepID=UPI000556C861|nr:hypothetical protein [Erwinia sp. 9145]